MFRKGPAMKPLVGTSWIAATGTGSVRGHMAWLAAAALIGFLVSYGSVTLGSLPRTWFVLVHGVVTGGFLLCYARWAGVTATELRRNWPLGLALGVLAGAFSVSFVLSQPTSPGPQGLDRIPTLLWLGLVYGAIDALLLTVLPVYSVWRIARDLGWLRRWPGWLVTAGLALVASVLITVTYHLGFPEFQGPEILQPVIGNAVFTLVYILSASPLAPVLSHVALHIAAAVHAYDTSIPLPPHYGG